MSTPLAILSDDLLLTVISYLASSPSDLAKLERTHRRWRHILRCNDAFAASRDSLWRRICARRWKDYPCYEALLDEAEWIREHPRWGPDGVPPVFDGNSTWDDGGDDSSRNEMERSEASSPPGPVASPTDVAMSPSAVLRPKDTSSWKWKNRYRWVEIDVRRTKLHSPAELESLDWYFNFSPHAGGRGKETLARCRFRDGLIYWPTSDNSAFSHPYELVPIIREERRLRCKQYGFDDDEGIVQGVHFNGIRVPHMISRIKSSGEWVIADNSFMFVSCDDKGTLKYDKRGFQTLGEEDGALVDHWLR